MFCMVLNRLLFTTSIFAIVITAPEAVAADTPHPLTYQLIKEIPLGAPEKWDFLFFDPLSHRVYISHGTEIAVVDERSGTLAARLPHIEGSHGVVIAQGHGYADSAATKTVTVFDPKTLKRLATVPVGEDADAVIFDPATKQIFVANSDGKSFTAIDAVHNSAKATVALNGELESMAVDGAGKLFINSASSSEIVEIDTRSLALEARWALSMCKKPHGLAIDAAARRLFVSCVNSRLLVVSADDGHIVATLPIGKGTDSVAFDPKRKLIFSANGEGTLSIIAERSADAYVSLGDIPTARGARTMALDSESGRIFLVTADIESTQPPKDTDHPPHFNFVPGTAKLLIFEPKM